MNQNPYQQPTEPCDIRTQRKQKSIEFASYVFDILEVVAFSVFVMVLVFTFAFRLCRVDGSSMENTLYGNQMLLVRSIGYTPEQDDIVVFHLSDPDINMEKTLVKRVIATGGQTLKIDFSTGEIWVDGVLYEDEHCVLKNNNGTEIENYSLFASGPNYNPVSKIYSATVPEGSLFVMGDNRNHSYDSRSAEIGFIDERCVLGKVIVRLSPFEKY